MKPTDETIERAKMIANREPLIIFNDKHKFITPGGHRQPAIFARQTFLQECPSAVVDKETLELIQVRQLHHAIDHTASATGAAALLRSLIQPSTDLTYIRSKQDALEEIASNAELRRALQDCVREFGRGESALYKFFNKGLLALFPYPELKRARQSAVNLIKTIQRIPAARSAYLKALLACLHSYAGSSIARMMQGSIFKTFSGLKSDQEVGLFTPKMKFVPRRFTKWVFFGPAVALAPLIQSSVGFGPTLAPMLTAIGIGLTGLLAFYCVFVKPVRDTGNFIEPFRAQCVYDKVFSRAIDAVGMIDELLSCHTFAGESSRAVTRPEVTDHDRHRFAATGLNNPILAMSQTDVVPNDVRMNGARLTFISGPNSGGKTTLCKSIVHNQLLAQMGAYVMAAKAEIGIADAIRYQAPKFDSLQDQEGRFGTELARTRDIFYATGPKSLVILDELAEGTTYEEKLHASFEILSDFYTIGNNTVLVTHNHTLVDRFMDRRMGQCFMAEFNGEDPTYRIIPGISRVAHAARVAQKINFSKDDRLHYMKAKGYL